MNAQQKPKREHLLLPPCDGVSCPVIVGNFHPLLPHPRGMSVEMSNKATLIRAERIQQETKGYYYDAK